MDLLGCEQELLHLLRFLSRKLPGSAQLWGRRMLDLTAYPHCSLLTFQDPLSHRSSGCSSLLSDRNSLHTPCSVWEKSSYCWNSQTSECSRMLKHHQKWDLKGILIVLPREQAQLVAAPLNSKWIVNSWFLSFREIVITYSKIWKTLNAFLVGLERIKHNFVSNAHYQPSLTLSGRSQKHKTNHQPAVSLLKKKEKMSLLLPE